MADESGVSRIQEVARGAMRRIRRRRTLGLVVAVGALALALVVLAPLLAWSSPTASLATVDAPDANLDGLGDAASNTAGIDPHESTPRTAIPAGWIDEHGLDLADLRLPERLAPYPTPPDSPGAYGPGGLPRTYRMTYEEVYSYNRPATWNESRDGVWDSGLDPRRWDVRDSRVPYSWLIKHGLDPFDVDALDRVAPGAEVAWTVREAYGKGLHPKLRDGDGDWIPDDEEIELGLDPRAYSTSGSGVADGWLLAHGLDPRDAALPYQDPTRSGMTIKEKFNVSLRLHPAETRAARGLDPNRQSTAGGPIPDGWLARYELPLLDPDVADRVVQQETITDANGSRVYNLTVLQAYRVNRPPTWNETVNGPWWGGTDPRKTDSDADGLSDLVEIVGWSIRLGSEVETVHSDPTRADSDIDGLTDAQEKDGAVGTLTFPHTDPSDPDSDGDGLTDGQEIGVAQYRGRSLPRVDPTIRDTARGGLADGEAADYWIERYQDCAAQKPYRWGPPSGPRPPVARALFGADDASACARLLPEGDARASGTPNLLNPDVDGDTLLNGWEARPTSYRESPYAPQPGEPGRTETDPANNETDGDGLPDGWEVRFGVPFKDGRGWNLDPSKWSSFGDDISDGDRDLLPDTVTWWSYEIDASGTRAIPHFFNATNKIKFRYGAHPNRLSSTNDGLWDAWKVFWGEIYPTMDDESRGDIYPGWPGPFEIPATLPAPRVGEQTNVTIHTQALSRYLRYDDANASTQACRTNRIPALSVCLEHREVEYTYATAARNATNPYLTDTDGDGMTDAWEAGWSTAYPTGRGTNPRVPDGQADFDDDGLDSAGEHGRGSNPYEPDSDFGGALDGEEADLGLDLLSPQDDAQASDNSLDSDGDGIPNLSEVKGFRLSDDTLVFTNPLRKDTDRDGLLDGRSLSHLLGRTPSLNEPSDRLLAEALELEGLVVKINSDRTFNVGGEKDLEGVNPSIFSTQGTGAPDSWMLDHSKEFSDVASIQKHYSFGKPAWWNHSLDGVWRWWLPPGETEKVDNDLDGLNDRNGEDPIPFASPSNRLPRGDPLEPGISPEERLARSQSYSNGWRTLFGKELKFETGLPPRAETNLTLDPLPANLTADGSVRFKGKLVTIREARPVANATVVLSIGSHSNVIGVAVTNETGAFEGPVVAAPALPAPPGSAGVPVFGSLDGDGVHPNGVRVGNQDPLLSISPSGPTPVFAWSYNSSWFPLERQNRTYPLAGNGTLVRGALAARSSPDQSVKLLLGTHLESDSANAGRIDTNLTVNLTLSDAFGRPIPHAKVTATPGGELTTDEKGQAKLGLVLPTRPGPFNVTLAYAGAATLLPSRQDITVTVSESSQITLFPPPGNPEPGQTFTVLGRLTTGRGEAIPSARIAWMAGTDDGEATTDATGAFAVNLSVPVSAKGGNLAVVAEFGGDPDHSSSRGTLALVVVGRPRWELTSAIGQAGEPAFLAARLLDNAGEPIGGGAFTITDGTGRRLASNVTKDDGSAIVALAGDALAPGEHTLLWRYSDAFGGTALSPMTFVQESGTTLTLRGKDLVRGLANVVAGELRARSGAPLPGQMVSISVGNRTAFAATDAAGAFAATLDVTDFPPSPVNLVAAFEGSPDGVYHGSSTTLQGRVRDAARFTPDKGFVLAAAPQLEGRLTRLTGEPLGAVEITVTTPAGSARAITDAAGRVRLTLPVAGAPLGRFEATFTTPDDERVAPMRIPFPLLLKDTATLEIGLPTRALSPDTLSLRYHLSDSRGNVVKDAKLFALVDGARVATTTDTEAVRVSIPPGLAVGFHTLAVGLDSDVLEAPEAATALTIQRPTTLALVSTPTILAGASTTVLDVELRSGAEPLPNQTLLVRGGSAPVRVITDENGHALVPLEALAQSKALVIDYPGAGENAAATLAVQVKTVPAPSPTTSPLFWAMIALLLLPVAAAAFVVVRRLRPGSAAAMALRRASKQLRAGHVDVRVLYSVYLTLLDLARLTEEEAEALTFGDLLGKFVDDPSSVREERQLLHRAFDRAIYAEAPLDDRTVVAVSAALDKVAEHVRVQGGRDSAESVDVRPG